MLVPIEARGARARVVAGGASILVALLVVALVCLGGDSLEPSADLSWSNSFDDGEGVLGGQQHGVTRLIQSCDADDPGCSFQISPDGYAAGHWRSSEPTKDPALTIQVRKDMKKPSSFEDDTVGNVVQWLPHVIHPAVNYYRLNPPPQEYASTQVEDSQDAETDAKRWPNWELPRRIVVPLSKSDSRGEDYMEEGESAAAAGHVDTEWPGVGAPKGFLPAWREAGATTHFSMNSPLMHGVMPAPAAASGEEFTGDDAYEVKGSGGAPALLKKLQSVIVELTADETSILNKLQAVDATATPAAAVDTAEGAPALLKKLQSVIVEGDASKREYTELHRKLNALNRVVARLNKGAQEAQGRYVQFAADETRILADLKTVDNENVGGLAAAADTAAAAEDVDTAEAVAGDTQVASPAAEEDMGLGDNSTAT